MRYHQSLQTIATLAVGLTQSQPSALAMPGIAGPLTLAPQLQYRVLDYLGQRVHVVSFSLATYQLGLFKANGLETVSALCARTQATACINAGFFRKDGRPAGTFKIGGRWLGYSSKMRGVVGWSAHAPQLFFDRLRYVPDQQSWSSSYSPHLPWWDEATEVVGGAPLLLYNGEKVDVSAEKTLPTFLTTRYARTAIGTDQQQNVHFVMVDGGDRLSDALGFGRGLTIAELTDFLQSELACVHALNLDGGKSSAMVLDGKRVSTLAFPQMFERAVSDVLVISPKP